MTVERLQKILSRAGIASRRAAERLIVEGRVTVNGVTVRELGTKADPGRDDIRADGRRIARSDRRRYILLNKPRGYICTRSDPAKRPTVVDLLVQARALAPGEYAYPVGRLDYDSEGLLLVTDDGDLAARLTHPRHEVPRVYEARVLGCPDEHDLERLRRGVTIDGRRTGPADVRVAGGRSPGSRSPEGRSRGQTHREGRQGETSLLVITIREGRNRQVRKMCDAIGHPVEQLRRIAIGPLRDPRLKPGQWRELTPEEVRALAGHESHQPRGWSFASR